MVHCSFGLFSYTKYYFTVTFGTCCNIFFLEITCPLVFQENARFIVAISGSMLFMVIQFGSYLIYKWSIIFSDASTVMWPQTTQGHGQQQPSLSVVTTVWGVTSSMTNGTANMTHDPTNPGIPTTNTVNSVGHPYLSTSANPKQYSQPGNIN